MCFATSHIKILSKKISSKFLAKIKILKIFDHRENAILVKKWKSSNRLRIVAKWDMGTCDGAKWSPGSKEAVKIKIKAFPVEFPAGSAIIDDRYYGRSGRKFGRNRPNFYIFGFFGPMGSFCTVKRPHISFCDDSEPIWRFGFSAKISKFLNFHVNFRHKNTLSPKKWEIAVLSLKRWFLVRKKPQKVFYVPSEAFE